MEGSGFKVGDLINRKKYGTKKTLGIILKINEIIVTEEVDSPLYDLSIFLLRGQKIAIFYAENCQKVI